jgi:hypothetical protein
MTGSYLIIILTTVLFLTGLLQFFLKEKQGKRYVIGKTILIVFMVLAFVGSLVQNLQNDRDNRTLRDKATKSLELIEENKKITDQLVALNKTIAKKNEEIVVLNKKITELVQDSISWTTGGDNFCYFQFPLPNPKSSTIDLVLMAYGKHPVYDVQVKIQDVDERMAALAREQKKGTLPVESMVDAIQLMSLGSKVISIGTMAPRIVIPVGKLKLPDADKQSFQIDIWARNGHAVQLLSYHRVNGVWKGAMRTYKRDNTFKEDVEPGFPRNNKGEAVW